MTDKLFPILYIYIYIYTHTDFTVWHGVLFCINTAGWFNAVLKLGTCFFYISLYTVALILLCCLIRGLVPVVEIMPNTVTLPPPNSMLLLVHWGEFHCLGLHWTSLLVSQPNKLNFDSLLKWTQSHCTLVHITGSVANFNQLILFFFEMLSFIEATWLSKFISFSLWEIVCLDILMPRLALALVEIPVAVTNRSFLIHFQSISSLVVVFLGLPGGFLASHDQVSSSFLNILWIILIDFPIFFEISPIKSLCNLTISFLSSNDVIDFFAMFIMQEPV